MPSADTSRFRASIAISVDLQTFRFSAELGAVSSQPTIAHVGNGGYVVALEQDPNNHITVRYFADRDKLLAGSAARVVRLEPDIDHSVLDIGGYYFRDCQIDRQQRGTLTNFTHWTTAPRPPVDNAIVQWRVQGNIGDRDALSLDDNDVVELIYLSSIVVEIDLGPPGMRKLLADRGHRLHF
ncbi:hypothetical protein DFH09DRAFT_1307891 [Mycena vulgaris]|nr:hypothetical protein DFH09DRAFT_1307891 [Mycena vulgaris]